MQSSERCRSKAMDWADELDVDRRQHLSEVYFDRNTPNAIAFEVFLEEGHEEDSWRVFHRQRTNILYLIRTIPMWAKDAPLHTA